MPPKRKETRQRTRRSLRIMKKNASQTASTPQPAPPGSEEGVDQMRQQSREHHPKENDDRASSVRVSIWPHLESQAQQLQIIADPQWVVDQSVCVHLQQDQRIAWHFMPTSSKRPHDAISGADDEEGCPFIPEPQPKRRRADGSRSQASLTGALFLGLQSPPPAETNRNNIGSWIDLNRWRWRFDFNTDELRAQCNGLGQTFLVAFVIVLGVLVLIVICVSMLQPPTVELVPVDWNTRAVEIELSLASITRVVLFGEACNEAQQWLCSPGLRPEMGYLHDEEPFNFTEPFDSNCFKPWETTSSGFYIPAEGFLRDLEPVLHDVVSDLRVLADHGPPSFHFSRGSSTQFRYSTSGSVFIPPHNTLPVLPLEDLWLVQQFEPNYKVAGLPISTSNGSTLPITPTGRPSTPAEIHNLDLPLLGLWSEAHLISRLIESQMEEEGNMVFYYLLSGIIDCATNRRILHHLKELQSGHRGNWGSDQGRMEWMYGPKITHVSLTRTTEEFPTPRPSITDTSIPSDMPPEYLKGWLEFMIARRQSSSTSPESLPTGEAQIGSPYDPSKLPSPKEYASIQMNIKTAWWILDRVLEVDYFPIPDLPIIDEKFELYEGLPVLAEYMTRAHRLVSELRDRVLQVTETLNEDDLNLDAEPDIVKETKFALRRLKDVAPFPNDIAVVRLSELAKRTDRGLFIFRDAERRKRELHQEIKDVVLSNWVTKKGRNITLHYFPDLESMEMEWGLADNWIYREGKRVRSVWRGRESGFIEQYLNFTDTMENYEMKPHLVWSRWDLRDQREDPAVRHAFCWDLEYPDDEKTGIWWWLELLTEFDAEYYYAEDKLGWWRRKLFGDENQIRKCGDASERHGPKLK